MYGFTIRCVVALILCVLIGAPASIAAIEVYSYFLSKNNYSDVYLGSGHISIAIIGLIAGYSFTFAFGTIRHLGSRLSLGAIGGCFFGLIHSLLWINHSFAGLLGFWTFFVPYSITWGAICGLVFSAVCSPILRLLSVKPNTLGMNSEFHFGLAVSSFVAIACAMIPIAIQFGTGPNSDAYVVVASFDDCPNAMDFGTLHSLSIPDEDEGFVLTINQKIAAVIGPYKRKTAQSLRTTHIQSGKFVKQPFLLDVDDVLDDKPCE